MKTIIVICAAVGLTLVATYLVVSYQKAAEFNRERDLLQRGWDAERAELEAALKAAKRPGSIATANSPGSDPALGRSSAHEILEKLKKTRVLPGEQRNQSVRHIIHQLESLADLGPDGLPAIRDFLGKFEDVDYSAEPRADDHGLSPEGRDRTLAPVTPTATMQNLPRLDSLLPPSLRLGVVQVLREMGGDQAEQVLAEMLSTSGRGVEVAYVARVLQEMVPNKYRDVALAAAKDLLANPPSVDRPNRLDDNAKNYLYGVLSMYNDPSFATTAQGLLVTQDGRVDRTALTYLTGALKDDSVPALYQAFKDNRVTNLWERASLASQILNYAGTSQQANDIFKEVVSDETLPPWLRATAIQTVAGGQGPLFGGVAPTDAGQIKARVDLLNSLPDMTDERLARARMEALQKLADSLSLQSGDAASGRSFRSRLDQGQVQTELPPPPVPATR
jgi:hypothetical protein